MTDALAGCERSGFTGGGDTRPVLRRGDGPAVTVIHGMPGLHPLVARFGERTADSSTLRRFVVEHEISSLASLRVDFDFVFE